MMKCLKNIKCQAGDDAPHPHSDTSNASFAGRCRCMWCQHYCPVKCHLYPLQLRPLSLMFQCSNYLTRYWLIFNFKFLMILHLILRNNESDHGYVGVNVLGCR